jgi:hypothetical protein
MTPAPKRRWLRFSLRTLFVVVTVFACWLGWNVNRVRQRYELIEYLNSLDHQASPAPSWVVRCDEDRLPIGWQLLGARHDWATWLVQNNALTDAELRRAKSLLPDCEITVNGP